MPAVSDAGLPELPRTWRPLGALIAACVFGAALVILCAVVWFAIAPDLRAQFTPFQRATLVGLGLMIFASYHSLVRSRVVATAGGLTVVNGYRSRTFEWSQVVSVSLGRGAPWGTLDLSDGSTISMIGVQGSDGARARRAIRELRALAAAYSPS